MSIIREGSGATSPNKANLPLPVIPFWAQDSPLLPVLLLMPGGDETVNASPPSPALLDVTDQRPAVVAVDPSSASAIQYWVFGARAKAEVENVSGVSGLPAASVALTAVNAFSKPKLVGLAPVPEYKKADQVCETVSGFDIMTVNPVMEVANDPVTNSVASRKSAVGKPTNGSVVVVVCPRLLNSVAAGAEAVSRLTAMKTKREARFCFIAR